MSQVSYSHIYAAFKLAMYLHISKFICLNLCVFRLNGERNCLAKSYFSMVEQHPYKAIYIMPCCTGWVVRCTVGQPSYVDSTARHARQVVRDGGSQSLNRHHSFHILLFNTIPKPQRKVVLNAKKRQILFPAHSTLINFDRAPFLNPIKHISFKAGRFRS